MIDTSKRVIVTKAFLGLLFMQVCAIKDATDEEILKVCNSENPCGTQAGWCWVLHDPEKHGMLEGAKPGPCDEYPNDRIHYLVGC